MTHKDLIQKAKNASSPADIIRLAEENGVAITEESANAYFAQIHKNGELADEELADVAGGGCHHNGKLIVSALHCCDDWICHKCESNQYNVVHGHRCDRETSQEKSNMVACCASCKHCVYEDYYWLCEK